MYQVSNEFKTAMKKAQRVEHVRGTVGGVSFADNNIMSLNYSNRCTDTKDVIFGSAYIGELDASFIGLEIERGFWGGLEIVLEYGLELDNEHTTEWVPCGTFTIASAEWTDTGVSVKAYDVISKLDIPIQFDTTNGKPYDLLSLVASYEAISIGRTRADYEAMPNGSETLTLYTPNDISTSRDFVSWVASSVGGFATSDRDGNLIVRSWNESETVDTILSRNRTLGSVFSDYSTKYSGISIADLQEGYTAYYTEGDGAVIAIGSNPFLQSGNKDEYRERLAEVARSIQYTPFHITMLNCPVYDLGDLIVCQGGIAGTQDLVCCIMSIEWTFKNTINLQGFGADPNLSAGKTKADKAISALNKQNKGNELIFKRVVSAHDITIDTTGTVLYEIDFAVGDTTDVNIWHEFKELNVFEGDSQSIQLYYYYDDELQNYSPIDTYCESGKYHTQKGDYWRSNVPSGDVHTWRVEARTDSGTAVIRLGDLRATLWGQKVVAVKTGGNIEITEDYTVKALGTPRPIGLIEGEVVVDDGSGQGGFLLLESGGYLLLESGGRIKLEEAE